MILPRIGGPSTISICALSLLVAPLRIRVNSICPGAIRTPINMEAWDTPEHYNALMKLIPYKRIGEVEAPEADGIDKTMPRLKGPRLVKDDDE